MLINILPYLRTADDLIIDEQHMVVTLLGSRAGLFIYYLPVSTYRDQHYRKEYLESVH